MAVQKIGCNVAWGIPDWVVKLAGVEARRIVTANLRFTQNGFSTIELCILPEANRLQNTARYTRNYLLLREKGVKCEKKPIGREEQ